MLSSFIKVFYEFYFLNSKMGDNPYDKLWSLVKCCCSFIVFSLSFCPETCSIRNVYHDQQISISYGWTVPSALKRLAGHILSCFNIYLYIWLSLCCLYFLKRCVFIFQCCVISIFFLFLFHSVARTARSHVRVVHLS